MADESENSNKRRFERERQRITCELNVAGKRHVGIVTDLSASGIFVQTSATPPIGSDLRLTIPDACGVQVELIATVRRLTKPHRSVASIERGGLGLRVDSAPEPYYQFLVSLGLG